MSENLHSLTVVGEHGPDFRGLPSSKTGAAASLEILALISELTREIKCLRSELDELRRNTKAQLAGGAVMTAIGSRK